MPAEFKFTEKQLIKQVRKDMAKKMRRLIPILVSDVQRKIDRGQPTKRITLPSGKKKKIGLDPSLPGEPPKVVTAALKRSVKGKVRVEPTAVIGIFGAHTPYALDLEFGAFRLDDENGNHGTLLPRPYIRPTYHEGLPKIRSILTGGA